MFDVRGIISNLMNLLKMKMKKKILNLMYLRRGGGRGNINDTISNVTFVSYVPIFI